VRQRQSALERGRRGERDVLRGTWLKPGGHLAGSGQEGCRGISGPGWVDRQEAPGLSRRALLRQAAARPWIDADIQRAPNQRAGSYARVRRLGRTPPPLARMPLIVITTVTIPGRTPMVLAAGTTEGRAVRDPVERSPAGLESVPVLTDSPHELHKFRI
jgi:hypothetical protein